MYGLSLSNKVEILVLDDLLDGWLVFMDLAALIDGFSGSKYKLIRTDYMLDLVALPMMQRLRHPLEIRTDAILSFLFILSDDSA
jgi:hypothetical protein